MAVCIVCVFVIPHVIYSGLPLRARFSLSPGIAGPLYTRLGWREGDFVQGLGPQ